MINIHSSRILKQCNTLSSNGFAPIIYSIVYDNQSSEEIIQGIPVKRLKLITKKLPSTLFFQILKIIEFYFRLKKRVVSDIIDCHCALSLLIGSLLKNKNTKLVYNPHELESEITGLSLLMRKIIFFIEKMLINKISVVIVVSDSIRDWYQERFPQASFFCIYNTPRYQSFERSNYFREYFRIPNNYHLFLYQGGLTDGRGIDFLLETFAVLPQSFCIVFMGYGQLKEKIVYFSKKHTNIFFHDVVPQNELTKYTSSVDYSLSLTELVSINHMYCMPNKLFESIMYSVPVIVSNTKDQAHFVKKHHVGYVVNNYSISGIKETILSINYQKRAELVLNINKIKQQFSWEAQEEKLIQIYQKI